MKITSSIAAVALFATQLADARLTYTGHDVYLALSDAAKANDVPVRLLTAICKVESGLKPRAVNNLEPKGGPARGICQVQLGTAEMFGFKSHATVYEEHFTKRGKRIVKIRTIDRTSDLYNPYLNAFYASKYLRRQLDRYKGDWVLAVSAYNAGRAIRANRQYVQRVLETASHL